MTDLSVPSIRGGLVHVDFKDAKIGCKGLGLEFNLTERTLLTLHTFVRINRASLFIPLCVDLRCCRVL